MYSVKVRRGGPRDYCELAWGCSERASERVRASGITASRLQVIDRPVYSLQPTPRAPARITSTLQHYAHSTPRDPTNSILPSNTSIVSTLHYTRELPTTTSTPTPNPREPIPTSHKAAQPATMKPVVSAFNAWTWYVASIPRERIHATYARAGPTKTTH